MRFGSKLHVIYIILAMFDISVVCAGVAINHHLISMYRQSLAENQWHAREVAVYQDLYAISFDLGGVVSAAYADGEIELHRTEAKLLRGEILDGVERVESGVGEDRKAITEYFGVSMAEVRRVVSRIRAHVDEIAVAQDAAFDAFIASGGDHLANPDGRRQVRKIADKLLRAVDNLAEHVNVAYTMHIRDQASLAERYSHYAAFFGVLVVLMVVSVTLYGLRFTQAMHRLEAERIAHAGKLGIAHEEVRASNARLAALNSALEDRVKARTAELEATQGQLLRRERLAAVGQLTATVAHELRNPLGAIRSSLYVVMRKLGDNAPLARTLNRVERNVGRCDRIITELLDFARETPPKLEEVAMDDWLAEAVREQPRHEGVEVELDLGARNVVASIDKERIRRAVINLYDNGAQAMAENPPEQRRLLRISTRIVNGFWEMRVIDNGVGMTPEVLEKIFEPLFSTRSNGVGLGVPTVRKIAEGHGGDLRYESAPGEGSTAILTIPLEIGRSSSGGDAVAKQTDDDRHRAVAA